MGKRESKKTSLLNPLKGRRFFDRPALSKGNAHGEPDDKDLHLHINQRQFAELQPTTENEILHYEQARLEVKFREQGKETGVFPQAGWQ